MATSSTNPDTIEKVIESKESKDSTESKQNEDEPSSLNFSIQSGPKTPRRMSIQQSINRALQQELNNDLVSSSLMGVGSGTQTFRMNRRIEKQYLQQIEQSNDP
eukprot:988819_1